MIYELISVLYFLIVMYFLGYSFNRLFSKIKFKDKLESLIMTFALGLGIFPISVIILNTLHIPLHWLTYLILSTSYPIYQLIKNKKIKIQKIKLKQLDPNLIIVSLLFILLLSMYLKGAFAYPYLGDDDPWYHSLGSTYVSLKHTYSVNHIFAKYLEPYPPTYDSLMGIIHQMNNSISWTLKFFNALLLSLTVFFMYYFVKRYFNRTIALYSTMILTFIPCYASRFIWAQTYALVLIIIALYFTTFVSTSKKENKLTKKNIKNNIGILSLLSLIIASVFVSQPSAMAIFFILYLLWIIVLSVYHKKFQTIITLALIAGIVLSTLFWIPAEIKFKGRSADSEINSAKIQLINSLTGKTPFSIRIGAQTRTFTFHDFFSAPSPNNSRIDQAVGLGPFLFILFIFSIGILIYYLKKNKLREQIIVLLTWLTFLLIGVEGNALPVNMMPLRFWAFFSLPVIIISAIGLEFITKLKIKKEITYSTIAVFILLIFISSFIPKWQTQTSLWPPGYKKFSSRYQIAGYTYIKDNFKNQPMFALCDLQSLVTGFDQISYPWRDTVWNFEKEIKNKSFNNINSFLTKEHYKYLIISTNCITKGFSGYIGPNKTQEIINQAGLKYPVAYKNKGFILFRVTS